jgi:hypothetical protein
VERCPERSDAPDHHVRTLRGNWCRQLPHRGQRTGRTPQRESLPITHALVLATLPAQLVGASFYDVYSCVKECRVNLFHLRSVLEQHPGGPQRSVQLETPRLQLRSEPAIEKDRACRPKQIVHSGRLRHHLIRQCHGAPTAAS